ncbi:hypothetical protein J7K27_04450 [Candidatus Bathyarchaeota archaeon]|nr:hypothetical protein [Candidatus Bathyarchaeota archaeon]
MNKKAIIVISLVKESENKSNNELEKEIFEALSTPPPKIPWMKNVEKVTVIEKA